MNKKMKRPLGILLIICIAASLFAGSAYAVNRYFEDAKGHWAEEAIQILTEKGVISGYPDGLAHPDEIITRGEFAALVARTMELPEPVESEVSLVYMLAIDSAIHFFAFICNMRDNIKHIAVGGKNNTL